MGIFDFITAVAPHAARARAASIRGGLRGDETRYQREQDAFQRERLQQQDRQAAEEMEARRRERASAAAREKVQAFLRGEREGSAPSAPEMPEAGGLVPHADLINNTIRSYYGQRYRQVTPDRYVDTEETPDAIEAKRERTERDRRRANLVGGGYTPEQAEMGLDNPALLDNIGPLAKPAPQPPREERMKADIEKLVAQGVPLAEANRRVRLTYGETNPRDPADPNAAFEAWQKRQDYANQQRQAREAQKPMPAVITRAVAENGRKIAVIDDALARLAEHPDAVGLGRGIVDAIDQRIDKKGVAVRAPIADIGSMTIHERSGANVTISEAPRLKPFIPSVSDTPETVRTKLQRLRERIAEETEWMQAPYNAGGAPGSASAPANAAPPAAPARPRPLTPNEKARAAKDAGFRAFLISKKGYTEADFR